MMWRKFLERYLGVEIPASELNSKGVLNCHFNWGDSVAMTRGGLGNRLLARFTWCPRDG